MKGEVIGGEIDLAFFWHANLKSTGRCRKQRKRQRLKSSDSDCLETPLLIRLQGYIDQFRTQSEIPVAERLCQLIR
jgi:hypothetical protein